MSIRKYPDVTRVYVDIDGVIADFEAICREMKVHPQQGKLIPGIYRDLPVMAGAVEGVQGLLDLGYFVMCLTKIPSKNPGAASEKLHWVNEHFPVLKDYVVITPDKGCVGTSRDYLIDDHPEWANANKFPGMVLPFGGATVLSDWSGILWYFTSVARPPDGSFRFPFPR